jgi:predicted transcriptional regulator
MQEKEVREIEKQKEARKGGRAAYRIVIEEWNEAE